MDAASLPLQRLYVVSSARRQPVRRPLASRRGRASGFSIQGSRPTAQDLLPTHYGPMSLAHLRAGG